MKIDYIEYAKIFKSIFGSETSEDHQYAVNGRALCV